MTAVVLYPPRPEAEHFPMMTEERFAELVEHIKANGLIESITLHEGAILDGRNRYAACIHAGIEPRFVEWDGTGGTPLRFVWARNAQRRDLTPSQRAMVGVEVLPLLEEEAEKRKDEGRIQGGQSTKSKLVEASSFEATLPQSPPPSPSNPTPGQRAAAADILPSLEQDAEQEQQKKAGRAPQSRDTAAAQAGVSPRYIQDAKAIIKADPELADQVKAGLITIPQAKARIRADTSSLEHLPGDDPAHTAELERRKLIAAYSKQSKEVRRLLLIKPSALAAAFDREHAHAFTILAADTRSWLDRVEQAAGSGRPLRLIGGEE